MSGLSEQTQTKRWIRPLPERLINKIAAGEVIERPAAVVKELVENALDAGATKIELHVEKSGAKLIKIVDNGCGIPQEQVEVAFSRHATSKIANFDDLERLTSYGFRGEALPSVASVSRTRMVTKPAESDSGTEIIVEGGVVQTVQPSPSASGTVIEVENLFFNTPARRKFLKSESTEARHISRTITAMAIARYDVGFMYRLNGRELFSLPAGQSLRDRTQALLGDKEPFVEVQGTMGPVTLNGYVGKPDMVQANRNGQYLFINNRFIQSPSLSHAFGAAYGELLPKGNFPVGALLLSIEPAEVDVNVHPTKIEVRLSREREVYDAVKKLIRESLHSQGVMPVFRPAASPAAGTKTFTAHSDSEKFSNHAFLRELYRPPSPGESPASEVVQVDTRTGEILPQERTAVSSSTVESSTPPLTADNLRLVGRFGDLFLLFEHAGELLIIDQHTAHERVLFEETLDRMDRQAMVGQQMLMPVQVELTPEQLAVYEESEQTMNQSGFDVSQFGGRTINIQAVPSILSRKSPERVFRKIIDDILSLKRAGYDLKKAMAESIACRAAVMSGDRLNDQEAIGLVTALLNCQNKFSCPHGRPTFIKVTREELERQFGRG